MSVLHSTPATLSDLLRVSDLTADGLDRILNLSRRMKAQPDEWQARLAGECVACWFAKPSMRTRVSFEAAAHRLGMLPIVLRADELQLARGEPVSDTARVLSGDVAAIVVRTFTQHEVEAVAGAASVPVINALTDQHHPCQALADLLTLEERFGRLTGLRLAYVGDGGSNVAHSLMEAAALAGMHLALATPAGYGPDEGVYDTALALAAMHGATIELLDDPRSAVAGADAIYTDAWVSTGAEAEGERRLAELRPYRVTADLLGLAAPHAVFMHSLPEHRGHEVAMEVVDGPQSVVLPQAANRMPTEQALLYTLITGNRAG